MERKNEVYMSGSATVLHLEGKSCNDDTPTHGYTWKEGKEVSMGGVVF